MIDNHQTKKWFVSVFLLTIVFITIHTSRQLTKRKQSHSKLDATAIQKDNDNLKEELKKLKEKITLYMENGTTVVDLVTFDDKQIVLPTSFLKVNFTKKPNF